MSDWLFDLGNSRFKAASWRGDGGIGEVLAWPHGADALVAGDASHGPLPRGRRAWLASVAAPALTTQVLALLRERFEQVHVAHTLAECAGVRVAYAQPARLGVDRFLALLGAHAGGGDVLVAGVGTALTIDLLDVDGRHHGGRIAASPTVMRQALHQRAVQLPAAGGHYREFADDTDDALASGCDGAAVALVERSLQQAAGLLGRIPALLLHGGGAEPLLPLLPQATLRPALVLEGLAAWARERHAADVPVRG
ncbi:type III pantothenate kinase [Pseudoxanthomonas daejeonensis]|uniref:type III pantothenate kinase n=1 Tax=Pseudoxanthomonas daejeonensis TaxID=266062 RepID=UPI001F53F75B|nr:type III pantothenate kinase [Pseudoxanthomonas daejeonensis]UNK56370.1 type III pantothenate kinase [Pseudoxanthomonas daejeonensis]